MRSKPSLSSAPRSSAADEALVLARHLARMLPHAFDGDGTAPSTSAVGTSARSHDGNGSQRAASAPRFAPWSVSLFGRHDLDAARALELELTDLVAAHPEIELLARAAVGHGRQATTARGKLLKRLGEVLAEPDSHARPMLWALLVGGQTPDQPAAHGAAAADAQPGFLRRTTRRIARSRLRRGFAASVMTLLIACVVVVIALTVWGGPSRPATPEELSVAALKVFVLWTLSFLPGWLYVRFLGQRASALWDEYVIHLHRLGLDRPEHLPRPPRSCEYYEEWLDAGGYLYSEQHNIYRQKFNAYYGPSVADSGDGSFAVRTETMFPVFLATALLAVCWGAVLWDTSFATSPSSAWDLLKYAFLGAYAFSAQSLIRRFFQSDLRPSAYAGVVLRLIVVLATMLALHQVLRPTTSMTTQAAIAFLVGIFPAIALQALQKAAATVLRVVVPQTTPEYPLNQLDGLNVWYEARLLEEGIEDMQNLATANLVDVMLHTRVPVGRLVDWIDQAHLFLHLDRTERSVQEHFQVRPSKKPTPTGDGSPARREPGPADAWEHSRVQGSLNERSRAGTRSRLALRQLGIRTATDLLKAFPPDDIDPRLPADGPPQPRFEELLPDGVDADQLRTLVRVLSEDTHLAPIWSWQTRGAVARPGHHRPRSLAGRGGS